MKYFALVDCNNFFASCEQLFDPKLRNQPVVILSNNDGCVIARSKEAKAMGIKMGEPAFKQRFLLEKGVHVLSSNFTLYGDLSERVMTTLEDFGYPVDVYSIDEAFIHLPDLSQQELEALGQGIREKIRQWIGLPIAVGIAPTKTLAKAANQLAKKGEGVAVLLTPQVIDQRLGLLPVGEVWGIGRQLAEALHEHSIRTIRQLISCEDRFLQKYFSVTLVRTVWELRGISCLDEINHSQQAKSMTCSRSFGTKVASLTELEEAVATYMAKAAVRLRAQNGCARRIHIFVSTHHHHTESATYRLSTATAYTPELIHYAHHLLRTLYKPGHIYRKAGVILSEIVPEQEIQPDLFDPAPVTKRESAMHMIDSINAHFAKGAVRFAAEGLNQNWKARSGRRSPRYTTSWSELPLVK